MTDLKLMIGMRVHELRISHDLTQAQFAELIDISVNFLSEIENGKKGMSQETLYKLCSKFSVSADSILFGIEKLSTEKAENDISPSAVIHYINDLDVKELELLSNYIVSLKELRNNILK